MAEPGKVRQATAVGASVARNRKIDQLLNRGRNDHASDYSVFHFSYK
jgi:hypothetical protein